MYLMSLSFCIKHKKHKKKLKKRKHRKRESVDVEPEHRSDKCNRSSRVDSSSVNGIASVLHEHETLFRSKKVFVNNQSEQHAKKSRKRKRHRDRDSTFDKEMHCKRQKVECDTSTGFENEIQMMPKSGHSNRSLEKRTSNTKLPKLWCSSALKCSVDSHEQKKCKKKETKKLREPSLNSHGKLSDVECKQKKKKKKRHKEKGYHKSVSPDITKCLLRLPVSNSKVLSDISRDIRMNTSEDGQLPVVTRLADVANFTAEAVHKDHKLSKSKHKHLKMNTDVETKTAGERMSKSSVTLKHKADSNQEQKPSKKKKKTRKRHESIVISGMSPNDCSGTPNHSSQKSFASAEYLGCDDALESGKSKLKQLKMNTDIETKTADETVSKRLSLDKVQFVSDIHQEQEPSKEKKILCESVAISETSPNDVCSKIPYHLSPQNFTSAEYLSNDEVLELLHAENSIYYLRNSSEVKEAG